MAASLTPVLPPISIVVPSLNQSAYIETALQSLADQHYERLEIIVMDGGSTDGTVDVLQRHAAVLTHWRSAPDQGPASALRDGFSRASGEIFGVLNADDFLLPDTLAGVGRFMASHPGADVVSGHGYFAMADGTLGAPIFSDHWHPTHFRYGACVLVQPATFFRRTAYEKAGGFQKSGRVCWDMELWAAMARTGATFMTIDRHLAAFRLHSASITGRDELHDRRRHDARAVGVEFGGGSDTPVDRMLHYAYRAAKFARHPMRTLRQRRFVFSALKRWSI